MRNAAEAMERSPHRALHLATRPLAGQVEVRVRDTGPGLADEIRAKLFQPFVTTKATGLGVGLSICRTIIEAHGGEFAAEDGGAGGAAFRFTLPAVPVDA
jgi:two-component system sensor kinase FixL